MHIYDTQIYILSTGPMLGTKFISLLFRVNIYNNSGVTQQPTVFVLEEYIIPLSPMSATLFVHLTIYFEGVLR